jgi:hypothetical protein
MTALKIYSFKETLPKNFSSFVLIIILIVLINGCSEVKEKTVYTERNISDSVTVIKMPDTSKVDAVSLRFTTNDSGVTFSLTPKQYDFSTYESLVSSIVTPIMSDKDKAFTLWEFVSDWVYYCLPAVRKKQMYDPLKMLNSFECGICGSINATLANLDSLAGLRSRVYSLKGHVVTEVFYDNSWHMFDADQHVFFEDSIGSVASVDYISRHPELIKFTSKRNHPYRSFPFLEELMKSIYSSRGNNQVSSLYKEIAYDYTNEITLNRKDEIKFNISKVTGVNRVSQFLTVFSNPLFSRKGTLVRNPHMDDEMNKTGTVVVSERSAYAIKKVSISAKTLAHNVAGSISVYYSPDGNSWYFKGTLRSSFSEITFVPFSANKENIVFSYFLKFNSMDKKLNQDYIHAVSIKNDFLFSDKLFVNGKNSFRVVKAGKAESPLRIKIETN